MKKLIIEWKHFDKGGKTCARCNNTGHNLKSVIAELKTQIKDKDITIEFLETKLKEKDMNISNSLFINGSAIEDILKNEVSVIENTCNSCGDLTGNPCCCRAIKTDDTTHDEIPKETIKKAIIKSLN